MNKTIAMLGMLTLMAGCVGTKVTSYALSQKR